MPQEFHVLQCSRCRTFQVQQVKKAKKWACKMCGEKQSVLRVYGRGTGAECRQHVQKLNSLRGELEEKKEHLVSATRVEENADHLDNFQIEECEVERNIQQRPLTQGSKWSQYIEPASLNQMDDDDDDDKGRFTTDRGRYNTSIHQQRKQKRKAYKQRAQNVPHMDQTTNDKASKSHAGNFQPMMSLGSSIKRPPENCLNTRAAKRTKWREYEDYDQNCENMDQPQIIPTAFFEPQISTNQQSRVIVIAKSAVYSKSLSQSAVYSKCLSQSAIGDNSQKQS